MVLLARHNNYVGPIGLHVHPSTFANYAEEKLEDPITLCGACHERFHFSEAL